MQFKGLMDMLDGGGAGQFGDAFEGGPLSGLLNALGIKPLGSAGRSAAGPQPTMSTAGPGPSPGYGPAPPQPPGEVSTSPLIGRLSVEDILAAIQQGTPQAPYRQPQMPQAPQAMPTLQEMLEMDRQRRAAQGGMPMRF